MNYPDYYIIGGKMIDGGRFDPEDGDCFPIIYGIGGGPCHDYPSDG